MCRVTPETAGCAFHTGRPPTLLSRSIREVALKSCLVCTGHWPTDHRAFGGCTCTFSHCRLPALAPPLERACVHKSTSLSLLLVFPIQRQPLGLPSTINNHTTADRLINYNLSHHPSTLPQNINTHSETPFEPSVAAYVNRKPQDLR